MSACAKLETREVSGPLSLNLVREVLARPNLAREVLQDPQWHARIVMAWQRGLPVGEVLLRVHDGLCRRAARRWHRFLGGETRDIYQEARLAVLRACDRWKGHADPKKYIAACLRHVGTRWVVECGSVVRLPARRRHIHRVFPFSNLPGWAFVTTGDGRDTFEESLEDGAPLAEEVFAETELDVVCKRLLRHASGCLRPMQRRVLHERWVRNRTLLAVAESFCLSRESIRQIETKALSRLRGELMRLAQAGGWRRGQDFVIWVGACERGLQRAPLLGGGA